jgi:hypothetical protein
VRAAARKAAVVTEQRLTAFRFLFLFFVARMKSGAALKLVDRSRISLRFIRATASGTDRDEAGHHHRLYLTKVGF